MMHVLSLTHDMCSDDEHIQEKPKKKESAVVKKTANTKTTNNSTEVETTPTATTDAALKSVENQSKIKGSGQ